MESLSYRTLHSAPRGGNWLAGYPLRLQRVAFWACVWRDISRYLRGGADICLRLRRGGIQAGKVIQAHHPSDMLVTQRETHAIGCREKRIRSMIVFASFCSCKGEVIVGTSQPRDSSYSSSLVLRGILI